MLNQYMWNDIKEKASQVALVVKNPPANSGNIMREVFDLGREDPLE